MIDNDEQLTQILILEMTSIVNIITDQLLEKLIGESGLIRKIVYDPYKPADIEDNGYQRLMENGGLLGEWDKKTRVVRNNIASEITDYPNTMIVSPGEFVHGSLYWKKDDIRDMLAAIVAEGLSGDFFGDGFWKLPRDFWSPLVAMLGNGTIDSIIEKEFKARGIVYIKI